MWSTFTKKLGSLSGAVKGLHLHQSLTGDFVRQMMREHTEKSCPLSPEVCMDYVITMDAHLPFRTDAARHIVGTVRPEYLVHKFMSLSCEDWKEKFQTLRKALGKEAS